MKPQVCILKTDGTNCDNETAFAIEKAGGNAKIVHLNALKAQKNSLKTYQMLILPGGFSYGDDIMSGKIFALDILLYLKEYMLHFIESKKLIIGICNGFQVLVRTGLLPFNSCGSMHATLLNNASGKFECRWIHTRVEKSPCVFTRDLENKELDLQIAHHEGNFYASKKTISDIEQQNLVVFRYASPEGTYPENPNGSINNIAGICDPSGHILGLMPHPERFVEPYQHPNWRTEKFTIPHGLQIFKQAIEYAKHL